MTILTQCPQKVHYSTTLNAFLQSCEHQMQENPGLNDMPMVNYGFYSSCSEHPGNDRHKTQPQSEQVANDATSFSMKPSQMHVQAVYKLNYTQVLMENTTFKNQS